MIIHFSEKCPSCGALNYWQDDDFPDSSKFDVGEFVCHACGKNIILNDGEDGTDYRPHIEGESVHDDNDHGASVKGSPHR